MAQHLKKSQVFDWLATPLALRTPPSRRALLARFNIAKTTFERWKKEFESDPIGERKKLNPLLGFPAETGVREIRDRQGLEEPKELDADDIERRIQDLRDVVHKEAIQGKNQRFCELDARLMGIYVEKREDTHRFELSADDHYRIREEAERELGDWLSEGTTGAEGIPEVSEERRLLSEPICEDTGQGDSEDS